MDQASIGGTSNPALTFGLHGGIGLHTPADVHYGLAGDTARQRSQTLEAARQQHPTRFATTHDPKILDLPASAWINEPRNDDPAA
jgi:putative transposase